MRPPSASYGRRCARGSMTPSLSPPTTRHSTAVSWARVAPHRVFARLDCRSPAPVRLARAQWRIYPTALPDVCRHLRIPLRHHDAKSDAEACARIVLAAEAEGWRMYRGSLNHSGGDGIVPPQSDG